MKQLPTFIQSHMDSLNLLCMKHGVRKLCLFGSALTEKFDTSKSDLDFLVEFTDPQSPGIASRFMGLAEDLEALFERRVDLITKSSVRNPLFKEQLASNSQALYAA